MMARLLLFGGTTEAREILERGIPALCCVATDYGADLIKNLPNVKVRVGRLDSAGMGSLIQSERISCVLDATHPYATEVTKNIRAACENTNTPLFRVSRALALSESEGVTVVRSCREAAEALNRREGNALLTVGSKELREFAAVRDYQSRLFARVLPTPEVLRECGDLGFDAGHIIAMKGPFSFEMNRALLKDTGSSFLVTKDGGASGGTEAKFKAARELGVEVILIARPEEDGEAHTVEEGILWARRMLGLARPPLFPLLTDVEGKNVLVVGGGAVALRRTATLLKCGARVWAVSPVFRDDFPREATRIERPFEPGDLEGASLAVAASDDREINQQVGREAKARAIPVSVADCAAEGSFYFPSLVASGEAAATVSTGGLSCSLTRRLADRLRAVWESWVAEERGELEKDGCAEHGQE
ncbi:MAG: precorrin-6A reductase [Synergistaceae bacterium]|nr:precorrin-6A reductase [Synergistaceae bacterium]